MVVGLDLRLGRNRQWNYDASFDSLLSRAGLGHLKNGSIVRGRPPIEDCLSQLMACSTQAGTGCTDLQLIGRSVSDCQALT